MLSDRERELLDCFDEVAIVGQELADRINAWNEANLDEEKAVGRVLPDMGGDAVVLLYTDAGYDEDAVLPMLNAVGFAVPDESDDTVISEIDIKKSNDVTERLNDFLGRCIAVSNRHPNFVKGIELLAGNTIRKEEVKIVIPSDVDVRKLPASDIKKSTFMNFLREIRDEARPYSMVDEAFCFCSRKKEFWVMLHPLTASAE